MSEETPRYRTRIARRLSRHGGRESATSISAEVTGRLDALATSVDALTLAQVESGAALGETVERLDKQLARAGREQFKINALLEAQQKNVETILEQLREGAAYRERELARLREQGTEVREEGRLDIIKSLLPAIDGLGEALTSGQRMIERAAERARASRRPSFWKRLNPARGAAISEEALSPETLAAWLHGLTFVQERLLHVLAAEDVVPIAAEGQPFDPHRHVAVETVPATEQAGPGTIVHEHRRGYVRGDTVLRYAEVVVARAPMENTL